MKYVIEDEYGRRNTEDDHKYAATIKNRVHNNRIMEEKGKEFNIITNKDYLPSRAEDLFGKKIVKSTWERLQ